MNWELAQEACICGACPTFYSCGEKMAFCMPEAQTSQCIKVESGCICTGCPVQEEMGFKHEFYCTRGNESALAEYH
jgi:hypothetical protein